ncbi:MAG: hypothetical protein HDT28_01900 [Clostridiales bacterium]|nr:hypothetical protein [Clostridiales bacterium]
MSLKRDLAKEMQLIEEEIKVLEAKRTRSQAALIEAIISRRDPDENEMRYFRTYTAEIEVKRERLTEITNQLKNLV